jgi:hypothetical protein
MKTTKENKLALPVRKGVRRRKTYLISPLLPNLFIYN